jgi:hypothetical protein
MRAFTAAACALSGAATALRIDINGVEQASWERNQQNARVPAPVMDSFANHLHSVASLFSSILGQTPAGVATGAAGFNPAPMAGCYSSEDEFSQFPDWSGPYCLISYDQEASCAAEFNCHFHADYRTALPEGAKLCCRASNEQWSDKFTAGHDSHAFRVFLNDASVEAPNGTLVQAGHFGLTEVILHARSKPDKPIYINKFDMGAACKMWGEEYGYYSINPVPEGEYETVANGGETELSVCAMQRMYDQAPAEREVGSLMPFCTFKLQDQSCPEYAPLHLEFPREHGHLPQDAFYAAQTFLDTSGFCCSLTNHLTVDQTTVNLDYLPANWTMNDFQVIKWPYAACPVFEFPKMDLTVHEIEYSGKKEYPFEHAGLKITMCAYRQPPPTEASDEATYAPTDEVPVNTEAPESVEDETVVNATEAEELPEEFIELADEEGTVTRIEDKVDENVSGSEPGAVDDSNEVAYQESLMPQLEDN